jgi:hypothetical protein
MQVIKMWQAPDANLTTYEFDANLKLGHDLIDTTQPDQKIDDEYHLSACTDKMTAGGCAPEYNGPILRLTRQLGQAARLLCRG